MNMLTYNELLELRDKLTNNEITLKLAKELFWKDYKEGERAWHSKDWKERRTDVTKDKCQICGSREILTLQHLSHPRKYYEYERDVTRERTQSFVESNNTVNKSELSNYIIENYDYIPVSLCPKCKSKDISKRVRKLPQYLCKECKHEFDEVVFRLPSELIEIFYENEDDYILRDKCFVTKDKWKNQHNLSQVKYWLQRNKTKTKDSDEIGRKAFLLYLDDSIKYLSFEDTITACKKCASNFDLHSMDLCPICKENYKSIKYATCIQCLPEDKRKAVFKTIEFGKKMHKMHKNLGID